MAEDATQTAEYSIHIPQGRDLTRLPLAYGSLEQAQQNFQLVQGVARWCLIGVQEPGGDGTRFVAQGRVRGETVEWRSLVDAPPANPPANPPATLPATPPANRAAPPLREHMTSVLTPRLGYFVAEEVVRHVCGKFQIDDVASDEKRAELQAFLRLGLTAYMNPNEADDLASRCALLR